MATGVSMAHILPNEVTPARDWAEGIDYKDELVDYLFQFNKVITFPAMDNIYNSVITTKHVSTTTLKVIEKRFQAIPYKEINDPLYHVIKYWKIFTSLELLMNSAILHNKEAHEKIISFNEFCRRNGYLTKKQVGSLYWTGGKELKNKIGPYLQNGINEDKLMQIFKEVIGRLKPTAELDLTRPVTSDAPILDTWTKAFYYFADLTQITQEVKTEQEPPQEIPTGFLSLVDMRNALLYREPK